MDYNIILLGIFLVFLIYFLYRYFNVKGKTIADKLTLKAGVVNATIPLKDLSDPTASNYFFSAWIYVKNKDSKNDNIIAVGSPNSAATKILLRLDNASKLSLILSGSNTIIIMDDFPLQKWVYVIVSVDYNILDFYIDGKLIRSVKNTGNLPSITTTDQIMCNLDVSSSSEMYLANFERFPFAIDPTLAQSKYMSGNGANPLSNYFSSYEGSFSLSKDNLEIKKVSLF